MCNSTSCLILQHKLTSKIKHSQFSFIVNKITLFGISYDDNFQLWIKICLVRNSLQIYFYAIKFFQRIRDFFLGKLVMNFHLWFEKESIWNCMFSFTLHIIFMRLKIWRSWSMVSKTCTIKVTPMLSAVYYHRWVVPLGDSNIKYPIRTQYEVFTNNFWRGKGKNCEWVALKHLE